MRLHWIGQASALSIGVLLLQLLFTRSVRSLDTRLVESKKIFIESVVSQLFPSSALESSKGENLFESERVRNLAHVPTLIRQVSESFDFPRIIINFVHDSHSLLFEKLGNPEHDIEPLLSPPPPSLMNGWIENFSKRSGQMLSRNRMLCQRRMSANSDSSIVRHWSADLFEVCRGNSPAIHDVLVDQSDRSDGGRIRCDGHATQRIALLDRSQSVRAHSRIQRQISSVRLASSELHSI